MSRLLSTLLVLGLLGGTAAAFAITEGLKLEKSPITRTHITKVFSPVCGCRHDKASIDFRLRHADTVTVTIVRPKGETVTTLADHYFRRGTVKVRWNGQDEAGSVVPDGTYRVRVHLGKRHQTINFPNTIQVDTTPPTIAIKSVHPAVISPDHDGRAEYANISFRVSGSARPLLYVNGKLAGRGRLGRAGGTIHWFGKNHGRAYPAGVYRLALRAEDRAGNVSKPTPTVDVRIRFISLGRKVVRVPAGKRFSVRVSADSKLVRWLLHGRLGEGTPGMLKLRAPKQAGRYRLFVTAVGHTQTALVIVTKR
ncbi:MAG TPA: FlgD immunoglobulin-like domain containing protein [Gaiellaceae bacterium]